ncbi:3-(3-hydroxy-phenyl)propionate hydroxylase [Streptomyces olivoverticillatus]|uniref:3-(3-hydroxy-phenyl)propionate hydroxylase n=1 Tax=Streptomyces olivoverticillatus TaxID=66427 RepID=A0A7W7LSM3_9ACTN|nr:3-(3-hydroxy-phenyl)propionate hydroxylase [Streptomyces olivoverticillatus]
MDPVTVVGAGPVGLTLALALARYEVPVIVLDEAPAHDAALEEHRLARTAVLRPETGAFLERLGCTTSEGARWAGWRTLRRRTVVDRMPFTGRGEPEKDGEPDGFEDPENNAEDGGEAAGDPSPLHLPQHALTRELRAALAGQQGVEIVADSKLTVLQQDATGVTVHTRGGNGGVWRSSYLVGCDGSRSVVRKLLGARFPGRTAVERYAVAALRAELPWPDEAVLHRSPPRGGEVTARPLPDGVWRLDWLLPADGELVTPDALLSRVRDSLSAWCGDVPPYELLDTGVHAVHHRLARRWRSGRAFLAGDAAHLMGALGTQGLDEGLRDAENLSWKLALAWHQGASDALLDSYQAERRGAVAARLRAADRALPSVRGDGGWRAVRRTVVPGAVRSHDALLTEGHLGRGILGAPPVYSRTPLIPSEPPTGAASVATAVGAQVEDVPVTAPDGSQVRLRDRLGGDLLVVLIAPGTAVWERRHWLGAGLMPGLAAAVSALPMPSELLVAEGYPGAAAHTVLVVRPDGHLVAALSGARPAELYACADTARGGAVGAAGTDAVHDGATGNALERVPGTAPEAATREATANR